MRHKPISPSHQDEDICLAIRYNKSNIDLLCNKASWQDWPNPLKNITLTGGQSKINSQINTEMVPQTQNQPSFMPISVPGCKTHRKPLEQSSIRTSRRTQDSGYEDCAKRYCARHCSVENNIFNIEFALSLKKYSQIRGWVIQLF